MEGYIGEIRMFAGNFPPKDWAYCQGQLLAIASYQSLYSIIGIFLQRRRAHHIRIAGPARSHRHP
jgi:hypothetical protein